MTDDEITKALKLIAENIDRLVKQIEALKEEIVKR